MLINDVLDRTIMLCLFGCLDVNPDECEGELLRLFLRDAASRAQIASYVDSRLACASYLVYRNTSNYGATQG
jgi:hypothetical protein